jgi:hypothetical protein
LAAARTDPPALRLRAPHRRGIAHRLVEDRRAGWVKHWRNVADVHEMPHAGELVATALAAPAAGAAVPAAAASPASSPSMTAATVGVGENLQVGG